MSLKKIMQKEKCCDCGCYEHQVPMPIRGRRQDIDYCIADLVCALNAANIITTCSCCGHGKQTGLIMLEDGREIIIKNVRCKNPLETTRGMI